MTGAGQSDKAVNEEMAVISVKHAYNHQVPERNHDWYCGYTGKICHTAKAEENKLTCQLALYTSCYLNIGGNQL